MYGDIIFDFEEFSNLPLDIKRRLLAAAQQWVSSQKYRPRLSQIDALLASINEKTAFSGSGTICYSHDKSIKITRELNSCVNEIEAANGLIFDNRWELSTSANCAEFTVKCLGENGFKSLDANVRKEIPYKTIIVLPALFKDSALINFPFLDPQSKYSFNFCKQPFDQFLLDH